MLGWLTALLFTLVAVVTLKTREGSDDITIVPDPSGDPLVTGVSKDYQELLDAYSRAFMAAQETKDQKALNQATVAINEYQNHMQTQIRRNQMYIQTFLDDYKDMNPELDSLHERAQVFRTEGPKVADELAASAAETPPRIDYGGMVTRVIAIVLILGATFALTSF
jgi:chaperonin cofactor prefoldin